MDLAQDRVLFAGFDISGIALSPFTVRVIYFIPYVQSVPFKKIKTTSLSGYAFLNA
jgi:hypothetical protein